LHNPRNLEKQVKVPQPGERLDGKIPFVNQISLENTVFLDKNPFLGHFFPMNLAKSQNCPKFNHKLVQFPGLASIFIPVS
jgi:hypothetical protein